MAQAQRQCNAASCTVLNPAAQVHSTIIYLQQAPEAAPELQRLYRDSDMLEDSKTLADLKLDADSVLAMACRQEGGP